MTRDIIILILTAFAMFQAGYLFNDYLEYRYAPVPIMTQSEAINLIESAP